MKNIMNRIHGTGFKFVLILSLMLFATVCVYAGNATYPKTVTYSGSSYTLDKLTGSETSLELTNIDEDTALAIAKQELPTITKESYIVYSNADTSGKVFTLYRFLSDSSWTANRSSWTVTYTVSMATSNDVYVLTKSNWNQLTATTTSITLDNDSMDVETAKDKITAQTSYTPGNGDLVIYAKDGDNYKTLTYNSSSADKWEVGSSSPLSTWKSSVESSNKVYVLGTITDPSGITTVSSINFTSYPTKIKNDSGTYSVVKDDGTTASASDIVITPADNGKYEVVTLTYDSYYSLIVAQVRPKTGYEFADGDNSHYTANVSGFDPYSINKTHFVVSSPSDWLSIHITMPNLNLQTGDVVFGWSVQHSWTYKADATAKAIVATCSGCGKTQVVYLSPKNVTELEVEVTDADADKSVTWSTSNSTVATVDSNGKVTAGSSIGSATITATSTIDSTVSGTIQITVE